MGQTRPRDKTIDPIDIIPGNPFEVLRTKGDGTEVEHGIIAGGDVTTDFEGGGPMPFVTDTTRGNKRLSIESPNFKFGQQGPQEDDWLQVNGLPYDAIGYPMQFDGTIIGCVAFIEDVSAAGDVDAWLNGSNAGVLFNIGTGSDKEITVKDLNIDFDAGDKLRVRLDGNANFNTNTFVMVYVKWRGPAITTTTTA